MRTSFFTVLLVGILGITGCKSEPKPTPEELYSRYFTVTIPASVNEQKGVAASTLEQQAFRLLREENYAQAAILFSELAASQRASGYMLYRGMAQLARGETRAAIGSLRQVRPSSAEYDPAQWNLALAHLQQDAPAAAKETLQTLISRTDNDALRQKAAELKEKL